MGLSSRVRRGGDWIAGALECSSAYRSLATPEYRYGSIGFRVQNPLFDGSDVNAADLHVAAGPQSVDLSEYRLHVVPLDGSHLDGGDEKIE